MYIEYNLRGFLTILFRQKAKFILAFTLILLSGIFYLANMKPERSLFSWRSCSISSSRAEMPISCLKS